MLPSLSAIGGMSSTPMKTWAGFETVAGGGRVPLSLMVTSIADAAAIRNLLAQGNPRVRPEPGSWMSEGPGYRQGIPL